MYNIIQLSNKELGELQDIAKEMGIKGIKSLERQDLIYRILDEQAIAGAQKKVAAEEGKNERRQRTRINKKEVANKVYSADKDKAEKINDTPKIIATPKESKIEKETIVPTITPQGEEATNITTDKTVHDFVTFHITFHIFNSCNLIACLFIREHFFKLTLPHIIFIIFKASLILSFAI